MKEYNIEIPNYTDFEKKLQNETDFFKYMELLKEALPNYVLIITTSDTPAGPAYTPAHAEAMMSALGLKLNMINAFRMPYVAVIDHGKLVYESTSNGREEPVSVNGTLGKHSIGIYSSGLNCNPNIDFPNGATIIIDGKYYIGNCGYNFFLYNIKEDFIVDMCVYEAWNYTDMRILQRPALTTKKLFENLHTRGGGYFVFSNYQCLRRYQCAQNEKIL